MSCKGDCLVYNKDHNINVFPTGGVGVVQERTISVKISELASSLTIKIKDVNDYSFNYVGCIDCNKFEKIKREQCLDVEFEDFKIQLLELLKKTLSKEMLVRLESNDLKCTLIFYEKSKLKCLIFLVLELDATTQKDIVLEMTEMITNLKDENQVLSSHLVRINKKLDDKDAQLRKIKNATAVMKEEFVQHLNMARREIETRTLNFERKIAEETDRLQKKLVQLSNDVDTVRTRYQLRRESNARLLQSMQMLQLENQNKRKTVEELQLDLENANKLRHKAERNAYDLKIELSKKESDVDMLQKQLGELKRDIQDATMIIAQKAKTNDEIAKDLVQANQMIVTFGNQYDLKAKEAEEKAEEIRRRDELIDIQRATLKQMCDDFEKYKSEFNAEQNGKLKNELLMAQRRIEELDRLNREMTKLNGVLTKRLSNGELFEVGKWGPLHKP